jgi:hypothetical protein
VSLYNQFAASVTRLLNTDQPMSGDDPRLRAGTLALARGKLL